MKTLKGVIAASVYADYQTPLDESNLYIEPWYFILSSTIYPIEFEDAAGTGARVVRNKKNRQPTPVELAETTSSVASIIKTRVVKYLEYANPPELAETTSSVSGITKTRMVSYSTLINEPELAETSGAVSSIIKTRSAGYVTYINPPELAETSALVGQITKVRQL